jgi:hypothetical protein
VRLAENLPAEGEHGVAAEHENTGIGGQGGGNGTSLHPGQGEAEVGGVLGLYYGLVNATDLHVNVDTGGAEKSAPSRTGGSEHETRGVVGLHGRQRYKPDCGWSGGGSGAAADEKKGEEAAEEDEDGYRAGDQGSAAAGRL